MWDPLRSLSPCLSPPELAASAFRRPSWRWLRRSPSSAFLSPASPPTSAPYLPPGLLPLRLSLSSTSHCTLSSLGHGPAAAAVAALDAEEGLEDAIGGSHEEPAAKAEAPPQFVLPRLPRPKLSVKERKELASYAHGLGKKLKSQQVGKGGVTPSLVSALTDNLESNELLKLKIHGNCPGELPDVILQLEESTGSIAVDQIGRSVILYRPENMIELSRIHILNKSPAANPPWMH